MLFLIWKSLYVHLNIQTFLCWSRKHRGSASDIIWVSKALVLEISNQQAYHVVLLLLYLKTNMHCSHTSHLQKWYSESEFLADPCLVFGFPPSQFYKQSLHFVYPLSGAAPAWRTQALSDNARKLRPTNYSALFETRVNVFTMAQLRPSHRSARPSNEVNKSKPTPASVFSLHPDPSTLG